ncbi:MAG: zf-HC2 domain-containing protein [Deltaproteobacteria bacterium]|nr:zf-HC2 domain-containing protein [Deltaproteobacteria bacterium]
MHCDEIRIKLSAYLDNELEAEISWRVEEHLAECCGCRKELKTLKTINQRIMDFPWLRVSEGFDKKIMSSVDKSETHKKHEQIIRRAIVSAINFFERLFGLISTEKWPSTQSLDEFGDFPPCSLGRVYFKLIQ